METSYEYTSQDTGIERYFVYYQVHEVRAMLEVAGFCVVETEEYSTDYERDDHRKKQMVPSKARIVALRLES